MTGRLIDAITRRTLSVALVAVGIGIWGWSSPAAQGPGKSTIQFNTASGARDSTNFGEPFAVQVNLPQVSGNMPATVTVTLSNGNGQDQTLTLTRYKDTNSYVSQTITVDQGAQATGAQSYLPGGLSRSVDPVKVENGGTMTVSNGTDSTSITVYQNASQQAIARNVASMDIRSEELSRISQTARDGIAAIDKQLAAETDPAVRDLLQKARAELVTQRDIANRESAALGEGRRMMQEPARQDLPMWRYTDQFKLAMSKEFLILSKDPRVTTHDWTDAYDRGVRIAKMQWDDVYQQFVVDYVRGWYEATASLSLAGPAMTLFGGKTIYWKDATLGERLSAFKELAVAFAMIKGLPKVVDIAGEKLAGEIGGYKGNTSFGEIVVTKGGGASRAGEPGRVGVPAEPARGTTGAGNEPGRGGGAAGEPARVGGEPGPGIKVKTILSQAAQDSFNRAAEQARANGVPDAEVQQIVDETMRNAEATAEGQGSVDALAEGELNLAAKQFEAKYPAATAITDVETLELVRTVRVKAALEAQGKPQSWSPAERSMLDFLNTPGADSLFELEDPFGFGAMAGLDSDSQPGYTPVLDGEDAKNIATAAKKPLKVVDTPADPAVTQKLKDFRAKQADLRAKLAAKSRGQATQSGQEGKGQTQVLKPGDIKNTFTPRKPMLDLRTLKDAIVAKRLQAARKAVTGKQSPLTGERGQGVGNADAKGIGRAVDVNRLTPEKIQTLTPDEVRRITPQEIRDMPADARQALPLERMNGAQLRAIAEAEGIPAGVINAATGLETPAGAGAGQSQKQKDAENNRALGEYGKKLVGEDPAPPKTASSGISAPPPATSTAGTMTINPDGTVAVSPFPGGAAYPGVFTPNAGLNLFPPGTAAGSSTAGVPVFTTDPFALPLNRFVIKPDGSVVYSGLSISGLGVGGLAAPDLPFLYTPVITGIGTPGSDVPNFPLSPFSPVSGLTFTPPARTPTGPLAGDGTAGGNVVGGGSYPLAPIPMGPLFGFGDRSSFDPARAPTPAATENTGPAEIDLGGGTIGPFVKGPSVAGSQFELALLPPTTVAPLGSFEPLPSSLWAGLKALLLLSPGTFATRGPAWAAHATAKAGVSVSDRDAQLKAGAHADVQAMFVSLGLATGDAFQVTAINDGNRAVRIAADAVVLEPLSASSGNQIRKEMQDAIKNRGPKAPAPMIATASGYCLDYLKAPPTAGGIFRIASAQLQEQFAPLRNVLQAEQRLEQLGKLVPDIDPAQYFHQLRQWALWSKAEGFTKETFAKEFVDHARKNFTAAKQPWTKAIESQIASLVPHRWQEIAMVLQEAAGR